MHGGTLLHVFKDEWTIVLRGLSSEEIWCGLVKRIITLFLVPKDDTRESFMWSVRNRSEIAWCSIMAARISRGIRRSAFQPGTFFSIFVLYVGCHDRLCRRWSSVQFSSVQGFVFFLSKLLSLYQYNKGRFKACFSKGLVLQPFLSEDPNRSRGLSWVRITHDETIDRHTVTESCCFTKALLA